MTAKKILVIDDDVDMLKTLEIRLKACGYEVVTALNGKEGLFRLKNDKPDLVVLDVLMPVMGGLEFYKTLRADSVHAKVPVLVCTGRALMRDIFETIGVDDFISKPIDGAVLVSKVADLLCKRALILCHDPVVVAKAQMVFRKYGYEVAVIEKMDDLIAKGATTRYDVLLAHLAIVSPEPVEFLKTLSTLKHKIARIIAYSDVNVKGFEDGSNLAIDELRLKWRRAGVHYFFDPRSDKSFTDIITSAL
ncbi:MAG: response regulator [Candidatus Omnitrophota bacterium]